MPGRSASIPTIVRAWNMHGRTSAGTPSPADSPIARKPADGTIRHFSEQVVADGAGGWVGTITDFTDLVAARDNLRKAETLFRNTFDQAPIGIAYADRER